MATIIEYNKVGQPINVHVISEFHVYSVPYDEKEHGWMLDQLKSKNLPLIQIDKGMEYLKEEANRLIKERFT